MMELMNVNMKKIISILLPAALLFCSAGNASGEVAETDCYRAGPEVTPVSTGEVSADSAGNLADYGIDPEEALRKMRECIGQELPAGGRMPGPDPARTGAGFFDVTGDGCTDLCTCVTWGSGMVRTDLLVYDPLNEELYVLDGYNYDYRIERVEDGRIVIVKEGPHGYNDPVTKTYGTVKLENRQLIFEADSEAN